MEGDFKPIYHGFITFINRDAFAALVLQTEYANHERVIKQSRKLQEG